MNELLFAVQVAVVFGFTAVLAKREWLAGWMGLLAILANLFVTKQIRLFGLDVTASDVYAVGLFLSLNILQEFWGVGEGRKAIRVTLGFQLFFLAASQLHLLLEPNGYDTSQSAFMTVLGVYPRILFASLFTLWIVQRWDLWFFGWVKKRFLVLSFSVRNMICLMISQAFDTVLFSWLGLSGIAGDLFHVMAMSFAVKMALIALTPLITLPLRRYAIQV